MTEELPEPIRKKMVHRKVAIALVGERVDVAHRYLSGVDPGDVFGPDTAVELVEAIHQKREKERQQVSARSPPGRQQLEDTYREIAGETYDEAYQEAEENLDTSVEALGSYLY